MKITAKQVKELRELTQMPMMECKTALVKTNGDIEAAIKYLRKASSKKIGVVINKGDSTAIYCIAGVIGNQANGTGNYQ